MSEEPRLILRVRPETEAALIAERLQQIAAAPEERVRVEICADPETAQAMLRSDEAAMLCQVYSSPERFLSRTLRGDGDLGAALGAWAEEARDMLALHRQNRRRSLLFEAVHFCRYSDTGLARLGFSSGSVILSKALEELSPGAPLPGLIAQAHLQACPAAVDLREELDASAQLLSNDAALVPPLPADLALQDYRAQALRLAEAEQERDKAKDQTRTTLESLKALRAEAASKEAGLRAHEADLARLQAERDSLEARVAERDAELRARATEIDSLRAERDSLEARVAERDAGLRAHEADLARLQAERDSLEARVAERDADLRARVTEIDSLRAERDSLGARVAERDDDLARLRSERATERRAHEAALEDLRADLAGKEAALGAARQDISRVGKERDLGFETRDGRIADLDRALQDRQQHVQALEAQIERIMTSRSMRITAPLRHLRALFGRRSDD